MTDKAHQEQPKQEAAAPSVVSRAANMMKKCHVVHDRWHLPDLSHLPHWPHSSSSHSSSSSSPAGPAGPPDRSASMPEVGRWSSRSHRSADARHHHDHHHDHHRHAHRWADAFHSHSHISRRRCSRTLAAAAKLKRFFGVAPPEDVTVGEIEKDGLKALLRSTAPMCYFLHSLLADHCSENLFFFLEVEQYEAYDFASEEDRCEVAAHIFNFYLARNSVLEVNIDDRASRSVVQELENDMPLAKIFEKPKNAVIALMEGSYFKFAKSHMWDRMVEDLGYGSGHTRACRRKATHVLSDYLRDHRVPGPRLSLKDIPEHGSASPVSVAEPDALDEAAQLRGRLITTMVTEFCLQIVKVDITHDVDGDAPPPPPPPPPEVHHTGNHEDNHHDHHNHLYHHHRRLFKPAKSHHLW